MKFRSMLSGLIAATSLAAFAGDPSPARVQMDGFITAFNTGDRAKIEAFGRDHMPPDFLRAAVLDDTIEMFQKTGGFDVVDVTESGPHSLQGHVRERRTKNIQQITVRVDGAAPERITDIWFHTPDDPATPAPR
jgi:D-alanyl-D-alanine carboxypeptidase